MRYLVYKTDYYNSIFYCIVGGRKTAFYLQRHLAKIFMPYLRRGVLVDFEIRAETKKNDKEKSYVVNHFNQVISLRPYKVIYDIDLMRDRMAKAISKPDYYLFLDFEMTMNDYYQPRFVAEIVQFGAVLTDDKGKDILNRSYYIKPVRQKRLSNRMVKFLNLDKEKFLKEAKDFKYFYDDLKKIITKYHPKIVVWGRQDNLVLEKAYQIHKLEPITTQEDFINLHQLHVDYFNLKQSLGLFNALKTYFPKKEIKEQEHNASDDARITKIIFFEFLKEISN